MRLAALRHCVPVNRLATQCRCAAVNSNAVRFSPALCSPVISAIGLMLFRKNAPPPPGFLAPLFLVFALLPAWNAWTVFSRGNMESVHCNGLFAGSLCALGSFVGRIVFGASSQHYGYGLVASALAGLLLYMAYGLHVRHRKGRRHET